MNERDDALVLIRSGPGQMAIARVLKYERRTATIQRWKAGVCEWAHALSVPTTEILGPVPVDDKRRAKALAAMNDETMGKTKTTKATMLNYDHLLNATTEIVAFSDLHPSSVWQRQTYTGIDDLAESIAQDGLQEALLVRSRDGGGYEVVRGHRRRLALAKIGVTNVIVIVREMSDEEVLVATAWDLERADLTPLEEADLYDAFRRTHGLTVEQIATRVARDVDRVRRRLTLLQLAKEPRDELAAGRLLPEAAEEVALYAPDVQRRALPAIAADPEGSHGAMLRKQARDFLKAKFSLRLAEAQFDKADDTLVPAAGACTSCPKRSGAQRALFPDFTEDRCLDAACWTAKGEAAWERLAADLRVRGKQVLSVDEARPLFLPGQDRPSSSKYVLLDDTVKVDADMMKYRDLLGGAEGLSGYQIVVVRNPNTGSVWEMISARDAALAADARRKKGQIATVPTALEEHTDEGRKRAKEEKVEQRQARAIVNAIMRTVVEKISADGTGLSVGMWRWLARLVIDQAGGDVHKVVAARLDLTSDSLTAREQLHAHVEKLPKGGCIALAFEVLLSRGMLASIEVNASSPIAAIAGDLGLDLNKIRASARQGFQIAENARASKRSNAKDEEESDEKEAPQQPLVKVERRRRSAPKQTAIPGTSEAPTDPEYDAIVAAVLEHVTRTPIVTNDLVTKLVSEQGLDERKVRKAIVTMIDRKALFPWGKGAAQTVQLPEDDDGGDDE